MSKRLLVGLAAVGLFAAQVLAGVRYTAVTKNEGEGAKGKAAQPVTVKLWAEGDAARIEYAQKTAEMPVEGYMLTQNAGQLMYMVNPKEKTYMKWDMDAMMGAGNAAMKMMSMKYSEPKVEQLLDEAGPAMLGYPTRHCKFRTSYSMEMTFMGMAQKSSTVQDEEVWSTDKVMERGLDAWAKNMAKKTGNAELDKLMKAQMGKIKGLPLKMVIESTTTDGRGQSHVSHTTTEVTELKEEKIPSDMFELPVGYKEMTMPVAPGMPPTPPAGEGAEEQGAQNQAPSTDADQKAPSIPANLLQKFMGGSTTK